MKIFSKTGRIFEKDDKTNICHSFTVSEGAQRLIVRYAYSPKTVGNKDKAAAAVISGMKKYDVPLGNMEELLPVKNLVTLSFDDPKGYRGACHRQPNEQTIVITERDSTPGIFNRKLPAGQWQVVLNIHYAGCEIHYSIDIEEETV